MTEQDRRAMDRFLIDRWGNNDLSHLMPERAKLLTDLWQAACSHKDRQHAAEIAEARKIIEELRDNYLCAGVPDFDRMWDWLNAHPEEG